MARVILIDKCEDCVFYSKAEHACYHIKMKEKNGVEYQVYLDWYKDNKDADGFPIDCPFPIEQDYLDERIKNNIMKAWSNM